MWHEAGVSELTVAPILSTMIDVNRVADMFDLLERAELSTSNCSTIDAANARNAVTFYLVLPLAQSKVRHVT
uniref:Uncharacterized protein n=1 Tax=Parascaris equorum TaxID=6256 RepID=A0A914RCS4_PAREQ